VYALFFIRNKLWKQTGIARYFKYLFLFLLGASVYLYLPIRASAPSLINWGNPVLLKNFFAVLSRNQYSASLPALQPLQDMAPSLLSINPFYELIPGVKAILDLTEPLMLAGLALVLYLVWQGSRSFSGFYRILFSALFFFYSFFIILVSPTPAEKLFTLKVFFLPAWMPFYVVLLSGLHELIKKIPLAARFIFPILGLLALLLNYPGQNKKEYLYAHDYAMNLIRNAPYQSLLFTLKDNETFPLWELYHIREKRKDLILINLVLLSEPWYWDQLQHNDPGLRIGLKQLKGCYRKTDIRTLFIKSIMEGNPGRDVFFSTRDIKEIADLKIELFPSGILYSPVRKGPLLNGIPEFSNIKKDHSRFLAWLDRTGTNTFRSSLPPLDQQTRYAFQSLLIPMMEQISGLTPDQARDLITFIIYLNQVTGLMINNIQPFAFLGNLELQARRWKSAVRFYRIAASLQPQSSLAGTLRNKINELLRAARQKKISLYQKAETYYGSGDYLQAVRIYRELLSDDADDHLLLTSAGDCFFNMQKYQEAVTYYSQAIRLKKDHSTAYYNLGGCYLMLNNREQALRTWKEGLRNTPDDARLIKALDEYK
ncbi:MAG: tetratricopeptide repeat protein, partial [bacterium]|nr:tetratricopeptide repeat protein [bacterium]